MLKRESPDLQLEREEYDVREETPFKYFELTEEQKQKAKELIDDGFEMLNISSILQVSFQLDANKQYSESCIFRLDEISISANTVKGENKFK